MTKFFDANVRPPRQGGNFPLNGTVISAASESALHDIVSRWQKNNGQFVSDEAITAAMWEYWCGREPGRCGQPTPEAAPGLPVGPLVRAEITPEMQGPCIWRYLNTLAVQWTPGLHSYFLATCDAIVSILECPVCRDEWRDLLAKTPPATLDSKLSACQWVCSQHNAINRRKGKQQYPYERMVREFGAPMP